MKTRYYYLLFASLCLCQLPVQSQDLQSRTRLAPGRYTVGKNGEFYPITNVNVHAMWSGVWKQNTNGLRVELLFGTDQGQSWVRVGVGSVTFNSLGGYVGSPNGKFSRFELQESNGLVVPFIPGQAIEERLPSRIPLSDFPRWPNGSLKDHISFFTNGGPFILKYAKLDDLYEIRKEGDYTLTVCPAIYRFGTNLEYMERVDLPCITAKFHLKPSN